MRIFALLIFIPCLAHASCEELVHDGGWSADGQPGIVELFFDSDKTFLAHFLSYKPVSDIEGTWSCEKGEVHLYTESEVYGATFIKRDKLLLLEFKETKLELLSKRALRPFGI